MQIMVTGVIMTVLTLSRQGGSYDAGGQVPSQQAPGAADTSVGIETDTLLRAVVYSVSAGECRVSMTLYNEHSINKGGISHHTNCPMPLTTHHALYSKLLMRMFDDPSHRDLVDSVRWISWGRIGEGESEMSQRLMIAAWSSRLWDRRRGKPVSGDVNHFVKVLAESRMIYGELRDLFASFGWKIAVGSVEKVLIGRAGKLPSFGTLKSRGIRPDDALPFDCQLWFLVARERQE